MNVCPTSSGVIVDARAHVLIGSFLPRSFCFWTRCMSFRLTNGPFLVERLIGSPHLFRPRTMNRFDAAFFRRVLPPFAYLPQGDTGCRPPDLRPSPPPIGWATGFCA